MRAQEVPELKDEPAPFGIVEFRMDTTDDFEIRDTRGIRYSFDSEIANESLDRKLQIYLKKMCERVKVIFPNRLAGSFIEFSELIIRLLLNFRLVRVDLVGLSLKVGQDFDPDEYESKMIRLPLGKPKQTEVMIA